MCLGVIIHFLRRCVALCSVVLCTLNIEDKKKAVGFLCQRCSCVAKKNNKVGHPDPILSGKRAKDTYRRSPRTSKSVFPHLYAARVTSAIWGPRNKMNVCSPVPSPIDDATPSNVQYPYQINPDSACFKSYGLQKQMTDDKHRSR